MSKTIKLWRRRLAARAALLAAAQRRYKQQPTAANRRTLTRRRAQLRTATRIVARYASPRKLVLLDGTPIARGLARMLRDCRENGGWRGQLVSGYRGHGVHRFGKKTQADLWAEAQAGTGAPANQPGFSTHEDRHDGSLSLTRLGRAYQKVRGSVLSWWQCGMDVTDSDGLLAAAEKLGYDLARTYADPREHHHVNARRSPLAHWRARHKAGRV